MDNNNRIYNSMLYNGTAMPYLALFDANGIPVKYTLTDIPLGAYIDVFSYKYDETKENEFTLSLHVGNPDVVDIPVLEEGNTILIQWGYIYANGTTVSGPVKSMVIKNVDPVFDDSGVNLTIKGSDGVQGLRFLPPFTRDLSGKTKDTLSSYLDNGLENGIGIVIERY